MYKNINTQQKKLSDSNFSKTSLQLLKDDLGEILTKLDSVWVQVNDDEMKTQLEIAKDQVEYVYEGIEDLEEKADKVIQNVQDD